MSEGETTRPFPFLGEGYFIDRTGVVYRSAKGRVKAIQTVTLEKAEIESLGERGGVPLVVEMERSHEDERDDGSMHHWTDRHLYARWVRLPADNERRIETLTVRGRPERGRTLRGKWIRTTNDERAIAYFSDGLMRATGDTERGWYVMCERGGGGGVVIFHGPSAAAEVFAG